MVRGSFDRAHRLILIPLRPARVRRVMAMPASAIETCRYRRNRRAAAPHQPEFHPSSPFPLFLGVSLPGMAGVGPRSYAPASAGSRSRLAFPPCRRAVSALTGCDRFCNRTAAVKPLFVVHHVDFGPDLPHHRRFLSRRSCPFAVIIAPRRRSHSGARIKPPLLHVHLALRHHEVMHLVPGAAGEQADKPEAANVLNLFRVARSDRHKFAVG